MSDKITLKSFPFDYQEVLNEESGKMEPDREYNAEIYKRYFAKFLSNGVYFGDYKGYKENSMKVSLDVGLTIKVARGAGIIEGADYENEDEQLFTVERPATGNRIDRVIVRLDNTLAERNTYLLIKEGQGETPAELQRDENIYEICLAEITVKSTTNITEQDIKDTRLDKDLCGMVNSLITVDGEELYQRFQEYVDTVTENLVRKDQASTINGDLIVNSIKDKDNKSLSTEDFTTLEKEKLKNIAAEATKTIVDTILSNTSTNPVQNKVIKTQIDSIINTLNGKASTNVATNSTNGLMSSTDKEKLNGLPTRALSLTGGTLEGNLYTKYINSQGSNINTVGGNFYTEGGKIDCGNIGCDDIDCGNIDCFDINARHLKSYETYSDNLVYDKNPNMYITTAGNIRRTTQFSSKRYKESIDDIKEKELNPENLYSLPVRQFKYKKKYQPEKESIRYNKLVPGLIAEEVEKIYPIAVDYEVDENGNKIVENWNERYIIPGMLKLIQNHKRQLDGQKKVIEELKERINKLEAKED